MATPKDRKRARKAETRRAASGERGTAGAAQKTKAPTPADEPMSHRPFRKLKARAPVAANAARATSTANRSRAVTSAAAAPDGGGGPDPESFAQHMHGVRELAGAARRLPKTVSALEPRAEPEAPFDPDADARSRLSAWVTEGIRFDVMDDGAVVEGRRLDVDPRELRRLRKGAYGVDGRLDLHGKTLDEGRAAVAAFVRTRRTQGDRAVLIIHGRGRHSSGGQPVLRGEIGAWLSQGPAARDVAAFASVLDADGGSGAVLVLLAR